MGYSFKNSKGKTYYLHTKDVVLKGGRNQTIYYFAKDERSNSCDLPAGKKIVENEKTGLPFVKSVLIIFKRLKKTPLFKSGVFYFVINVFILSSWQHCTL